MANNHKNKRITRKKGGVGRTTRKISPKHVAMVFVDNIIQKYEAKHNLIKNYEEMRKSKSKSPKKKSKSKSKSKTPTKRI